MYKVTLVCDKNYAELNVEQEIEFNFSDFDKCKRFMELALVFSKNENIKAILEIEKELEYGNN